MSSDVIEAMRNVQTETERWRLAEALVVAVPSGTAGFEPILDQAKELGVRAGLTRNTLRLYRDAAKRWPAEKRVPNVSFSAHREAMVLPTAAQRVKLLTQLADLNGADRVTVAAVRKAIAVQNANANGGGTGTPSAPSAPPAKVNPLTVAVDDLRRGGNGLAALLTQKTPAHALDDVHAGLTALLAHVEDLRGKAARRKATARKAAAPAPAPEVEAEAAPKPRRKAAVAGDLRGL